MSRPSFQFYPGDWRKNANLGRCSKAARGAWVDVLCVLHDSDEYGVARYPLKELANASGCTTALLRELVDKGVLKGADAGEIEAFVYVPRSGRKDGTPVILLPAQPGPIWFSSRMVKDEHVRHVRGEGTRFGDDREPTPKGGSKSAPKPPLGDGPSSSSSSSASAKEKNPPPPAGPPLAEAKARPLRNCPETFLVTGELQRWARESAPLVDIRAETAIFRGTERKTGITDWPKAWRVWMLREQKRLAESAARDAKRNAAGGGANRGQTFRERDTETARAEVAAWTGGRGLTAIKPHAEEPMPPEEHHARLDHG